MLSNHNVAFVCLALAAGGCDLSKLGGGKDEGASPTSAPVGTTGIPDKGVLLPTPGQPSPGAAPQGGVPDIPESRSNPPTLAEWSAAPMVNTVGPNSAPRDCYMKIVREWLKVNCTGKIENVSDMEGFGKEGFDYFRDVKPGVLADLVVRIRRGNALKARINRGDHRASLFVNWPSGSPKPTIVALQHNPK